MKWEVEKPEICILSLPFIMNQTIKNRDLLPPIPFFDSDQVSDLPEVQFFLFYSFVKSPEEIGCLPSPRIFFPTEDSKQRE